MSNSVSLAHSLLTMEAATTRQALQTEMVRQNAQADAAVIALLQDGIEAQASLPAGQGKRVDVTV